MTAHTNTHLRLQTLDTFRGIAALVVVLFHLMLYQADAPFQVGWGATGVDLFFIISGFVIFMTLNKTTNASDFVIARFSRLYPVYWVAVSVTALCMAIGSYWGYSNVFWHEYWANMTMFQYYFHVRDLDGSYWTLIVEMLFYGLMLAAFGLKQVRRLEWIGFVLVLCQILIHAYIRYAQTPVYDAIKAGFPLVNHFQLFWAGILFYKIYAEGFNIWRLSGVFIAYGVTIYLFEEGKNTGLFIGLNTYLTTTTVYFVLFFLFITNRLEWINNRITLFLGKISYSLYVIHHYLIVGIITLLRDKLGWSFITAGLFAVSIAFIAAYLITYFVEKPALTYLRQWYNAKKISQKI
jgi:peptidoglycan/LPS O-acetylase OafA/YrhL